MRFLVVEDEPELADFLVRGLREEGFAVEHCANGRDGLARLNRESWDLVLLDWRLPGLDGLEVLKRFRERQQTTPVLFLTARDAVADRVTGLNAGADDYLPKPFAFDELLARVRALTRRRDGAADSVLRYEDVAIDLLSRSATRGGVALNLTAKEEALLGYFLRNPGQVLSRSRIYENVWDERYDGLSNTLEVHVLKLRGKLETRGRSRLIQTLRQRGYLFGAPGCHSADCE